MRLLPEVGPACRATVIDISELGMCLEGVPAIWCQGVEVRYGLSWRDRRLGLAGQVVWRRGDEVGIEFDAPWRAQGAATLAVVDRMLQKPLSGGP